MINSSKENKMENNNQSASGAAEVQPVVDPVIESKTVSYDSYTKLLGEKKSKDAKLNELQSRLDAVENERLSEQGKYKELNSKLMEEKKLIAENFGKKFKEIGLTISKQQFAMEAAKLGCVNTDDAFALFDLNKYELGDDFRIKDDELKAALSEMQRTKSYLFRGNAQAPRDLNSQFTDKGQGTIKIPTTSEGIIELMKALDNQKG